MKIFIILFTFQCIILMCQIINISAQRSQYDRDAQQFGIERYRRQKKSQRSPSRRQYFSTSNLINREDAHPNSYYNRMPTNKNLAPDGVNSKRISIDPTESSKIFHHHHHPHHSHHGHLHSHTRRGRPQYAAQTNPCYYRNAGTSRSSANTLSPQTQGRFLWDLNLYNIIPGTQAQYSDDCGGYGGGGGGSSYYGDSGGSLFSSNNGGLLNNYLLNLAGYQQRPQNRPYRPLSSNGLIPNSLPGIPNPTSDISGSTGSIGGSTINQNPDIYDPVYDDRPVYENQYASQPQVINGPNLTPGQIVGGIAQTVNGVIQTLSGNTQQGQFLRTLYNRNYRMRRYRN